MYDYNNFEKYPGAKPESVGERELAPEEDFIKAFETGVPEFAGNQFGEKQFGQATPENLYYGEAKDDEGEVSEEYNEGISDAAGLVNYGLNAAAREYGVEKVVQTIKGFDASGRENPIADLFTALGVDTPEEAKEIENEGAAAKASEQEFMAGVNNPGQKRSHEGAFKAIDDMKELIGEVEGADPRFSELREEAKRAQKGVFEQAVSQYNVRGLTELFSALAQQREKADKMAKEDVKQEDKEDGAQEEAVEVEKNDDELEKETKTNEADALEEKKKPDNGLNPEILQKQM